jgi:DNA polymerase-1
MAINMPIQGTNAEMIKLAMVAIQNKIKANKMESKMVLQVHDELVFEVPDIELESLQAIVMVEMESALPLSVPIVVDCGNGKSWFEAH